MRKPYTLVEILVAVSIIGILTATGLGITSYVRNKVAETQTQTTIKLIEMALQKYTEQHGAFSEQIIKISNSQEGPYFALDLVDDWEDIDSVRKNTIWGCFNDVVLADKKAHGAKIRGIRLGMIDNSNSKKVRYYILDGWGRPLFYLQPGVFNSETYDLISFGGDKVSGDGSIDKAQEDETPSSSVFAKWNRDNFSDEKPEKTKYPDPGEHLGDDVTNFTRN